MMPRPPVILMPPPQSDEEASLGIPLQSQNIFQRIIRDPKVNTATPKERECTEMLCSVLINAPSVQKAVLEWLCGLAGMPAGLLEAENIEVSMETECPIGAKRDDLRIEVYRIDDEGRTRVALLSIEVKAGAPIHSSGRQDDPDAESDGDQPDALDKDERSQIKNYDSWLKGEENRSSALKAAGIVLARSDMTGEMPKGLLVPWRCITWAQLGKTVMQLISTSDIPPTDAMLAKHLVGFIKSSGNGLWRAEEMKDMNLEFDDVALLRAMGTHGARLEQKVDSLVEPLGEILAAICENKIAPSQSKTLFKTSRRSVYGLCLFGKGGTPPYIQAGICLHRGLNWPAPAIVTLWVETGTTSSRKPKVKAAVSKVIKSLKERNMDWQEVESGWEDLMVSRPLHEVLKQAGDQQAYVTNLVQGWVEDLKAVGFVEILKKELEA